MKMTRHSVLAAVAALAFCGCATTQQTSQKWEYRIAGGYIKPGIVGASMLEPQLESAGGEGWEAVSWGQEGGSPPYYRVLLKRTKQ
jgi:hypothetical protein